MEAFGFVVRGKMPSLILPRPEGKGRRRGGAAGTRDAARGTRLYSSPWIVDGKEFSRNSALAMLRVYSVRLASAKVNRFVASTDLLAPSALVYVSP